MPANNGLSQRIVEQFADGEWHDEATIHFADVDPKDVRSSLNLLARGSRVTCNTKGERERRGSRRFIRLFRQDRMISAAEIKLKLAPLLKRLKEQGRKNMATMSPASVALLAGELEQHLKEWTSMGPGPSPGNGPKEDNHHDVQSGEERSPASHDGSGDSPS